MLKKPNFWLFFILGQGPYLVEEGLDWVSSSVNIITLLEKKVID